jgi:hypothetical protein
MRILNIFFIFILLLSFTRHAFSNNYKQALFPHIRNHGYDTERYISNGHIEFTQNGSILSADFWGSHDSRKIVEDSENIINQPQRNKSSSNCGWDGSQKEIFKNNAYRKSSEYENLHKQDVKPFSQYVKLGWLYSLQTLEQTFTFFASTKGELYRENILQDHYLEKISENVSLFPQIGVEWSGPSITLWQTANIVLQPLGKFIAFSQNKFGNSVNQISGENNINFESHDGIELHNSHTIFSEERMNIGSGFHDDMGNFSSNSLSVEGNINGRSSAIYGSNFMATLGPFGNMSFFIGESYSFSKENIDNKNKGFKHPLVNTIGKLDINFLDCVMLNYRIRFHPNSSKKNVSEIGVSTGSSAASLSGNYVITHTNKIQNNSKYIFNSNVNINNKKITTKQIDIFFNSQITEVLSFMGSFMKNMQKKQTEGDEVGRYFQYGIGAHYHNNIFRVGFTVDRQYYSGISSKPTILFMLTFDL